MLKVKKAVRNPKNKSQDNDLMDLQIHKKFDKKICILMIKKRKKKRKQ